MLKVMKKLSENPEQLAKLDAEEAQRLAKEAKNKR
jgi:hypothetical protein